MRKVSLLPLAAALLLLAISCSSAEDVHHHPGEDAALVQSLDNVNAPSRLATHDAYAVAALRASLAERSRAALRKQPVMKSARFPPAPRNAMQLPPVTATKPVTTTRATQPLTTAATNAPLLTSRTQATTIRASTATTRAQVTQAATTRMAATTNAPSTTATWGGQLPGDDYTSICGGDDGSLWATQGTNVVRRYKQTSWDKTITIEQGVKQVACAGAEKFVFVLTPANEVLRYNAATSTFIAISGERTSISSASDGTVLATDAAGVLYKLSTTTYAWTVVTGAPALSQIAVQSSSSAVGIDNAGNLYAKGASWSAVASDVGSAVIFSGGQIWAVKFDDTIMRRSGTTWTQIPGTARQIGGWVKAVYALTTEGTIVKYQA